MRTLALALGIALMAPAWAQDKVAKKKPAANQVVHKKPTPQQIRKFDELEKKQETKKKK